MTHAPHVPQAALGQALLDHDSFVRALARKLTNDPNEADDLVQDTYLATLRKRPGTDPSTLAPWLVRVLRNSLWTRRRAAARSKERERRAARPEAHGDGTQELARRVEIQQEIVHTVLALPEPYRGTVLLRYYEEAPLREIAERQAVPLETVRTRLRRAHTLLREALRREHGTRRHALLLTPKLSLGAKLAWSAGLAASLVAASWIAMAMQDGGRDPSSTQSASLVKSDRKGAHAGAGVGTIAAQDADPRAESTRQPVQPFAGDSAQAAYWEAVLNARNAARRFSIEDALPPADLQLREDVETLELAGFSAGGEPGLRARAQEITNLTGIRVVVPADHSGEARLDVQLRQPVRLADLFELLAHEAGPEVDWSLHGGAVHIGRAASVQPEPTVFFHSLADFRVDPDDYFATENERYPLFERVDDDEITSLVTENVSSLSWDVEGVMIQIDLSLEDARYALGDELSEDHHVPDALFIRHSAHAQLEVQRTLDHLRAFFLPDPGHARPGDPVLAFDTLRTNADRALARRLDELSTSVAYDVVPWERVALDIELVTGIEVYATTEFRETQAEHPVSLVLQGASVRAVLWALEQADPRFRWRLDFGRIVFEQGPYVAGGRQRLLIRDVRDIFDSSSTRVGALPFGGHRPTTWNGITGAGWNEPLTRDHFDAYLREFVAPASWDNNSSNRLRISDHGVLFLEHSPRVLAEVERSLAVLRASRVTRGR